MVKNWLITGGCGFLGTALIKALIEQKIAGKIRVVDNLSVGTRDNLASVSDFVEIENHLIPSERLSDAKHVELVVADIRGKDELKNVCQNMDIVVHLAANTGVPVSVEDPRKDMESNVIGTFNMLEASRRHKIGRFVFASSGAPLGEVIPPIHEELAAHPVSPYGASKLAGEGYCSCYYNTYGLETVVLRFGNVYGPGSTHKSSVVAKFIKKALQNQPLSIYGDGGQTRDFIYVDDLIDAIIRGSTKTGIAGEIFQIATGRETTVLEMTDVLTSMIAQIVGQVPDVKNTNPRLGDVRRNFSDVTKARDLLGWTCRRSLEEGIRETVQWFVNTDVFKEN